MLREREIDQHVTNGKEKSECESDAPSAWVVERINGAGEDVGGEAEGLLENIDAAPTEESSEIDGEAGEKSNGDRDGPTEAGEIARAEQ